MLLGITTLAIAVCVLSNRSAKPMTRLAVWTVAPGSKTENRPVLGFAPYRECTDQVELGSCAGRQNFPHSLVAVCTAIMMMLSTHCSIVQLSWLPGYADCFCEQHRVVTVQCFFVLTAPTTLLSLFCCYCLKVQARQQRPLGRAQRQNRG